MSDEWWSWAENDARELAIRAHAGQVDKAGQDYVRAHVEDVVRRLPWDRPDLREVGWLHDILEDTDVTFTEVCNTTGMTVGEAVVAITHWPHEPRADYYARVKANPLALRVKLADIASNTDPDRMALLDDETRVRLTEKYRKALEALT